MEWFFGTLIVGGAIWWWSAKRQRPAVSDHAVSTDAGLEIRVTSSVREYDPQKYRFDGLAYPEWRIDYADDDGTVTQREIFIHRWNDRGATTYFECWCFMRDERRTFRSDRILQARNLSTNRKVKSIRDYIMR